MAKATASQLIDKILETLKPWGTYQIIQILVVLSITWPSSNQLYATIYMSYEPPFRCLEPTNTSNSFNISGDRIFYATCKEMTDKTNRTSCPYGYEYNNPKDASFATEWDLVCDQSYKAQLAQTALVIGQAVGATLFTFLADRIGRRKACVISQWCMLAISIGAIFSPNPKIYTFIKFLIGVAQQGHVTGFFVMTVEVIPTVSRAVPHVISSTIWSSFLVIQVGFAYWLKDVSWRYLQVYMTITSVVTLIPNMLWLDESIRWLFANEKIEELKKIFTKATRLNNANPEQVNAKVKECIDETDEELHADLDHVGNHGVTTVSTISNGKDTEAHETAKPHETDEELEAKHKGTLLDLFKNKRLRITTLIMFFAWIVNSLTSFGLSLTASKLSGNRFLNYFLIAVVPIPAGFVSYLTLVKLGRRQTCMIFHALAGLVLISAVLLDTFIGESVGGFVTALTVIGRFAISASWNTLFLYTPELYPTNLRSLGLGISSSSSRIGGMLAPFSNLVIDYIPWLPGTIYGCSCFIVCLLVIYLPETLNRELPQTLDEIIEWGKEKKKQKKGDTEMNSKEKNGEMKSKESEQTKL